MLEKLRLQRTASSKSLPHSILSFRHCMRRDVDTILLHETDSLCKWKMQRQKEVLPTQQEVSTKSPNESVKSLTQLS